MRLRLHRYVTRYQLADGTPCTSTGYAYNKSEAAALAALTFKHGHTPEQVKTAICIGTYREDTDR